MAEPQPPALTPAATTTGDIEEELPQAKSAEDRKAAAALSSLDARPSADDDSASTKNVDQEAVRKAMDRLAGKGASDEGKKKVEAGKKEEVKKVVKVDQGDVTLLVEELELSKAKATDLLKKHEGDAVKAMRAYITASS